MGGRVLVQQLAGVIAVLASCHIACWVNDAGAAVLKAESYPLLGAKHVAVCNATVSNYCSHPTPNHLFSVIRHLRIVKVPHSHKMSAGGQHTPVLYIFFVKSWKGLIRWELSVDLLERLDFGRRRLAKVFDGHLDDWTFRVEVNQRRLGDVQIRPKLLARDIASDAHLPKAYDKQQEAANYQAGRQRLHAPIRNLLVVSLLAACGLLCALWGISCFDQGKYARRTLLGTGIALVALAHVLWWLTVNFPGTWM
jgi:hypothetical protein